MAKAAWTLHSLFNCDVLASGRIRAEIGRDLLGLPKSQANRASVGAQLESFVDQRLHFGRQLRKLELWPDLDAIARELAQRVETLKREAPDRPVFLSPFHYVSQYANIVLVERVGQLLGLESMAVVSGVLQNQYGDDHALIPGIKVLYTYGDEHRNNLGVRVARSLKRDGVAVLFADVPPFTMHRYPMQTAGVTMFGKHARIHNGIFRLGETFKAHMLPFYLRFGQGKFSLRSFPPLDLSVATAPQMLADYIETALLENYEQWLPAGHPAMYAFAPTH
ncbi:hypothetical protein [Caballeronia sp. LZ035]|uniref:hypothetical protein n=1 Tax=Caballeronia sp. LZ035 TaxID=3038568 RepID=UPI00285DFC0D|nr:hypothetical protein [Caballeronia sp. LZ035]MDR5762200.1 hypothetical protein [Caballeronia sp. LZ035]